MTTEIEFIATENPVLEAGVYAAQLERLEERTSKVASSFGGDGTYYSWKFSLLDAEHEGEYIFANSSTNFGVKAKARKWAEGILGRKIPTGQRVTLDDLLGVRCHLVLTVEIDKEGDQRNEINTIIGEQHKNGKSHEAVPAAQDPLFEGEDEDEARASERSDANEVVALIRRYEAAKKTLGWKPRAFDVWCLRTRGYTEEQIAARPGAVNFAKMSVEAKREVVDGLERAVESADQYDEDGDLKF